MKILQNVRYLARQRLPFRGHYVSNGNFILLKLRGLDSPLVEPWMKKKANTYLMISRMNVLNYWLLRLFVVYLKILEIVNVLLFCVMSAQTYLTKNN